MKKHCEHYWHEQVKVNGIWYCLDEEEESK